MYTNFMQNNNNSLYTKFPWSIGRFPVLERRWSWPPELLQGGGASSDEAESEEPVSTRFQSSFGARYKIVHGWLRASWASPACIANHSCSQTSAHMGQKLSAVGPKKVQDGSLSKRSTLCLKKKSKRSTPSNRY